ncbi:MAG: PaaX family transcriptional regulator [Rhodobacteraceae bacterium]|nr:PaaX family transcriptional regulator [Paracoccaceae bacterium]
MTGINDTWFDNSIAALGDPQNQRVWSVIVSLFGDMAQATGDRIGGSTLTRIIGPIGIKPEAIRVALHRLRKDGWIESARIGRTSVHFLTDFGREQSAAVTPRIYCRTPEIPTDWHVLIDEEGAGHSTLDEMLLAHSYISIGRHSALGAGPIPANCEDLLSLRVSAINAPDWLKTRIFPRDLVQSCQSLTRDLEHLSDVPKHLSPFQIATLRTLVVHRWRRVVLRYPDLPDGFHPQDWPGIACRTRVFDLLDHLPRPNLAALTDDPEP